MISENLMKPIEMTVLELLIRVAIHYFIGILVGLSIALIIKYMRIPLSKRNTNLGGEDGQRI